MSSQPALDDEDVVEVVKRAPILDALRDGPLNASRLAERLSFSRSTIHRATNRLSDLGMIAKRGDEFELTSFGRVAARRIAACRRELDTAARLAPFLDAAAPGIDFPVNGLSDASITPPRQGRPHFAIKRVSDLMADSASLRTFSAVVSPVYVERCCDLAAAGATVTAIFDRAVVDILFDEYAERARQAARDGEFDVLIHDACPFELFVFDDRVAMTAHRDDGGQTPFVESTDPAVYEWAEELFDRYASQAEFATLF